MCNLIFLGEIYKKKMSENWFNVNPTPRADSQNISFQLQMDHFTQ